MLRPFFSENALLEAGCDEAGRGCLAGPVVAAAVILPRDFEHPMLDDSKKLTEKQRNELRPIIEKSALAWAIGMASPVEIDEINILWASFLAMHRAIDELKIKPDLLLIDGNRFKKYGDVAHECIVKGDSKFASIAAASVLAKTFRDDWMRKLAVECPHFGWEKNAGYPTKMHRDGIKKHGPTEHHRRSFQLLLPEPLELLIEKKS